MSKKKHHHEEHEEHINHEAWVIPYADMLTLLMALFLVMWATGQTDTNKMKAVTSGFADSLGIEGNGNGVGGAGVLDGAAGVIEDATKPEIKPTISEAFEALDQQTEAQAQQQAAQQQLQELQTTITQQVQAAGLSTDLDVRVEERGLVVSIVSEGVLFEAGSATLAPEGLAVLDRLAVSLAGLDNQISVEGHTDDRPISTALFPSNWELSGARASVVVRYLHDRHRFAWGRLTAAAFADTRPRVPNTDDASRAQNRRVEIAILAPVPTPTQPPAAASSAPSVDPEATPPSVTEEMSQSLPNGVDTPHGTTTESHADHQS